MMLVAMVTDGEKGFDLMEIFGRLHFIDSLNPTAKCPQMALGLPKGDRSGDPVTAWPIVIVNEANPGALGFGDRPLASKGQPSPGLKAITQRHLGAEGRLEPIPLELAGDRGGVIAAAIIHDEHLPVLGSSPPLGLEVGQHLAQASSAIEGRNCDRQLESGARLPRRSHLCS